MKIIASDGLVAQRALDLRPFIVMEILERAQAMEARGENIIHMEIGEPDFQTPDVVKEAAHEALRRDLTKYTHSLGLPELRRAITESYGRAYGVEVDPERVIVTTGTSAGMLLTFSAMLDPGDEAIVSDPGYPCYPGFINLVGGRTVAARLREEAGWQPSPKEIERSIGPKTKAVVINSPANPTGTILPGATMDELSQLAAPERLIISDEIYHGMVYEGRAHTILEFTENAVVINGFSKLHAMTGWRLGYLIVPPELIRPIQKLQQNLFISAPTVSQIAAVAALNEAGPDIDRMVATYNERRLWLAPALKELGFGIAADPTGAFYVLVNAGHLNPDSYSLALEILEKAKVAVTPGIDFGPGAEGHLRFSYATSLDHIKEGCRRLGEWLKNR